MSTFRDRLFPPSTLPSGPASDGARKRSLPFKAPSRVDNASRTSSVPSKAAPKNKATPAPKKSTSTKASNAKVGTAKAKTNGFKPASKAVKISSDDDSDEDEDSPPPRKRRRAQSEEVDELEEEDDASEEEPAPAPSRKTASRPAETDSTPPIPSKLLTRLLYEGFEDKNMKIGKEAMSVVGKYVETFVREALARAVYEREEGDAELGKGTGDGFLQVEDLEKLAPQLLLDF